MERARLIQTTNKKFITVFLILALFFIGIFFATAIPARQLKTFYAGQQSVRIVDRNGEIIATLPNDKGHYAQNTQDIPEQLQKLLLQKEDRFFLYHLGFNPISIIRGGLRSLFGGSPGGVSTITQQLVKILLGNENERTFENKITELWYAFALELHATKQEVLTMYADSIYFGNQAQGIEEASQYYFKKPVTVLNEEEIFSLLAAISSPGERYPGTIANARHAQALANVLNVPLKEEILGSIRSPQFTDRATKTFFEINSLNSLCENDCYLTIDVTLTETLREILARNLDGLFYSNVKNGAIVVIKLPENEILAVVGSPNPYANKDGYNINMVIQPRPIGSTAKPFFYARAFEKGARPYTLVDDRKYKYEIGTGYPLYPKNFDGKYRGIVTLHEALSNSLNVPSVKVLEYVGLDSFYDFLSEELLFEPIQPLESYALGIALGALEIDLLTLSHYFSIFPHEGELRPLKIFQGDKPPIVPPMETAPTDKRVLAKDVTQLINAILSDRKTGVDQFSIKSELNISYANNYALKTGTSYDFHDSWVVGYTPDFLVGVWVGNSDNAPMRNITGQSGAGKVWHEAMELLLHSEYNKNTPFNFNYIYEYIIENNLELGLEHDNVYEARSLLLDKPLIISPFMGDVITLEKNTTIPLRSSLEVDWFINEKYLGSGATFSWQPKSAGQYSIKARPPSGEARAIEITIVKEETKM